MRAHSVVFHRETDPLYFCTDIFQAISEACACDALSLGMNGEMYDL